MTGAEGAGAVRPFSMDYTEPLWLQAVAMIRGQLASGAIAPGARLPPERELCAQLGISRVTLRKALAQLVDDGMLRPALGRGWVVAGGTGQRNEWPNTLESFTETAVRMGLVASSTVVAAERMPATIDQAERLQIAPGASVHRIDRVRRMNGVPIALDAALVPADLAPALLEQDFASSSLYAALASAGVELADAETTIEARAAEEAVAELLDILEGAPTLVMLQLVCARGGRPVLASRIEYAGERYRLRTAFSRG